MSSNKRRSNYRRVRHDYLTSLFSRMLAVYLSVTLILIFLVGVTVVALLHKQNVKETKARMLTLLNSVTDTVSVSSVENVAFDPTDETLVTEYLTAVATASDALIQRISSDETVESFYENDALWQYIADEGNISYTVVGALPDKYIIDNFYFNSKDIEKEFGEASQTVSAKSVIVGADSEERVLFITARCPKYFDTLKQCSLEIILVMLLAVLVTVISVYATTERTIRPFMSINNIVQRYSKGDFKARIPLSGIDEATQLAKSFNTMADQLNDLEVTRKSFVANVSHELRSPLTSMKGFLEAMQDGTIPPEDYDKYIDIVLSETKRMTTMVNDLLDLARIESGKTALRIETFDVNELIRRTLLTFEARIHDQNMDVEVRFAQEQYFVEADSAQISQVLRNLIDNAIKYSPKDSKLRLATYAVHRDVYVSVQDSGQGIPEEDIPHVFDRFYKVEKAHTPTKQSGTGLGLSIVKKIIDQHGQSITVQSTKGKGSNFTFTLKRAVPLNKRQNMISEGGIKNGI